MALVFSVEEVGRIQKDVGGPLRDGVSWGCGSPAEATSGSDGERKASREVSRPVGDRRRLIGTRERLPEA